MSNVKRVFVEKKPDFAVQAKGLENEIKGYLGILDIASVRVLNRMCQMRLLRRRAAAFSRSRR